METLYSTVVTFVMERKPSIWNIGFDVNFLATTYAGIVASSITYYVQGQVINKKGTVFASIFRPLMMIIVAVTGSFILVYKIFLGGTLKAQIRWHMRALTWGV